VEITFAEVSAADAGLTYIEKLQFKEKGTNNNSNENNVH
jgi:hypothetical protein